MLTQPSARRLAAALAWPDSLAPPAASVAAVLRWLLSRRRDRPPPPSLRYGPLGCHRRACGAIARPWEAYGPIARHRQAYGAINSVP